MSDVSFKHLVGHLRKVLVKLPDRRTGQNLSYAMEDFGLSAFSVFFTQSPSFLAHQKALQAARGQNNAQSFFEIQEIPCDNQIRSLLDPVPPKTLYPVYDQVCDHFREQGILQNFRGVHDSTLIALDGTWYHSSQKIHGACCSHLEHKSGEITYYHSAVTPVIVAPGQSEVIALRPEFITPQDGHTKQVPLTQEEGALKVNWCEVTVSDPAGKILCLNAWITDGPITAQNVAATVTAGRARWKIENENNNTLKTKGYHLEHNFGHGKEHLSSLLAALNILAFLFHTFLSFSDEHYRLIRAALPTRKTFFQDVRALTRYLYFPSWAGLLRFMMRGLEIGPYAKTT